MESMVVFIYLLMMGVMVAAIVAWFKLANIMADVAEQKGYGKVYNVRLWCILFGIFGYIYVLSLPNKVVQEQNQQIIDLLKEQNKLLKKNKNETSDEGALPLI